MFLLIIQAKTFGQSSSNTSPLLTEVSIKYSKASLYTILNDIQEKYKLNFYYSGDLIPLDHILSVDLKNQPLYKVLNTIFRGTSITYKVIGKQIVLVKVSEEDTNKSNSLSTGGIKKDTIIRKSNTTKAGPTTELDDKTLRNIREWKAGIKGQKKQSLNAKLNKDSTHVSADTLSGQTESKVSEKVILKNELQLKKKKITKFSIDLNLTVGSSFRKLTSTDKEGNDIIKKRSEERHKIAFVSEIQCTYYFSSYFSLSGGIGYMNLGEKGNYKDSTAYINSFDYFTLPITGSYYYRSGDFSLKAGLGIVPSILLSKGNQSIQYDKFGKLPPKKSISDRYFNAAYSIYAEGGYQINKMTLSAGIHYRHFLYSAYIRSSAIHQVNYLMGISVGLRYNF
jgi:hypothetical protein